MAKLEQYFSVSERKPEGPHRKLLLKPPSQPSSYESFQKLYCKSILQVALDWTWGWLGGRGAGIGGGLALIREEKKKVSARRVGSVLLGRKKSHSRK